MTVDTTYTPATYTGDGSTVAFALNHLVYEASHVQVTLDGTVTVAYTVTGINSPSGVTVTFDTAPASGVAIVIQRVVPYTQETDLENFDGNPADVTEKQFDLLAMADQQIAEASNRSIFVPVGTSLTTNEISGTINATQRVLTITSSGVASSELSQFGNLDVVVSGQQDGDLLVYNGTNWTNLKNNLTATTDPTVNNDNTQGYSKNSKWLNTSSGEYFNLANAATGAAVWLKTTLTIDELGAAATKGFIDDDTFATATADTAASSESIKAYVDAQVITPTVVTASNSATVDFLSGFDGDGLYTFSAVAGRPATDNVLLYIRIAVGGVAESGASDYKWQTETNGTQALDSADAQMRLSRVNSGSAAGEFFDFTLFVEVRGNRVSVAGNPITTDIGGAIVGNNFMGVYLGGGTPSGIQFLTSSGNVAEGAFLLRKLSD